MKNRNRNLDRDTRGFAPLLLNPYVILILIVLLIVGLVIGGLFLIYAPHISAAVLIGAVAVFLLIKGPFPDMRLRVGLPMAMIAVALMIYFYGEDLLAVVV